jgi:1-acyl-sn-glycerol-3-phosphate acyltransferase
MSSSRPPERGPFARFIGRLVLRLLRFEVRGSPPQLGKFVLIGAPHSSNWDFIVGMATFFALGLRVSYLGKHSLFWFPLGVIMRALGGIPVDRSAHGGVVTAMVKNFAEADRLVLALAPEGTRTKVKEWREGFYHVATQAKVPIVCGYIDWGRRCAGLGPTFTPTGDKERDIAEIRAFYDVTLGPRARKDAP